MHSRTNLQNPKIIPLTYPEFTSYPPHASIFSLIEKEDSALPWIYNNYIQIYVNTDFEREFFGDFLKSSMLNCCPCIDHQIIGHDMIEFKWGNIVSFIHDSIDMGYCLFMLVDTSQISLYCNNSSICIPHDIFIYGYDPQREEIYIADFFNKGKYAYDKCSETVIRKAYNSFINSNIDDFMYGVSLIRANGLKTQVDISQIQESLQDFLLSRNTYNRTPFWWMPKNISYGISYISTLMDYIDFCVVNSRGIEKRSFYVMYDQAKLMKRRIEYLAKLSYIGDVDLLISTQIDIIKIWEIVLNVIIKYNIKNSLKLVESLKNYILEAKDKMESNYNSLLIKIQDKLK